MENALFDTSFLQKLDYLSLLSKKLHRGDIRGEHTTYRKGASLEFNDFRAYQPGDDFRYIDWNIFSRLDRIFVKLFSSEEDLTIHILVDSSQSMSYGNPRKIDFACNVGAALGYIGLTNLDRVGVTTFNDTLGNSLVPYRSRKHIYSLFSYFSSLETDGGTNLGSALVRYARGTKRPGLAIVIGDLLDTGGYQDGLMALLYRRFDVVLIQVLDEEELEPTVRGAAALTDSESGRTERVTVDEELLALYRRNVAKYFAELEEFCLTHGIEYLRTTTDVPFEDLILKYLRQGMYLH